MTDLVGIASTKEPFRKQRFTSAAETLVRDVRAAVRSLRKSRVFVVAVVSTLALSIGANT
jgi:hypothetical protein